MRWTKAQLSLLDLARQPIRGCRVEVVRVEAYDQSDRETSRLDMVAESQIESALTFACGEWTGHGAQPRNLKLYASRLSYAFTSLQEKAGCTRGRDRLDRAFRALKTLQVSETEFCLWLCEARQLSVNDQEGLTYLLGYVAESLGMRLRLVFLTGPVYRWIPDKRAAGRAPCMFSGRLRARTLQLTKAGLEHMDIEAEELKEVREAKIA